jgi:tRNA1(Val) A37 N6-methylase TrmN6
LDRLSLDLWLLQKIRGHRATSDDVLLAGFGLSAAPDVWCLLDLGTGKGTVALLLCGALPHVRAVGVEAEPASADLALRSARLNGLAGVYAPRQGDLRDPAVLDDAGLFDLVCGAPPFMPVGSGVLPQDPLRAAGRFELRGGIADYARVAAQHLAPEGRVVLLMDGHGLTRLSAAFIQAGLQLDALHAVGPRPGAPPTYWIGVGGRRQIPGPPGPAGAIPRSRLDLRSTEGDGWSQDYCDLRQRLRLP